MSTTTALPDYIAERNRLAVAAGLTIEKQQQNGTRLLTWYRGTESQWRATPFCQRTKPFLTRPGGYMREFACFGLSACGSYFAEESLTVRVVTGPNQYRGVIEGEDLPEWSDDCGDGITAYGLIGPNGPAVAYVGQLDAMIARNIAPEAAREQQSAALDPEGWTHGYVWQRCDLPDGRVVFRDNVGAREKFNREKAAKGNGITTTSASTPGEWIKEQARINAIWLTVTAKTFKGQPNNAGTVFAFDRESHDALQDAINDLLDVMRRARVIVRDPRQADTAQVQRAHADQAFRAFLARSGVPTTGAASQ